MRHQFELRIGNTGNAAFENWRSEVARILRETANKVEAGSTFDGVLRDSNGNKCGDWSADDDIGHSED